MPKKYVKGLISIIQQDDTTTDGNKKQIEFNISKLKKSTVRLIVKYVDECQANENPNHAEEEKAREQQRRREEQRRYEEQKRIEEERQKEIERQKEVERQEMLRKQEIQRQKEIDCM